MLIATTTMGNGIPLINAWRWNMSCKI